MKFLNILKFILNSLRRLAAVVYAVAVTPVAFVAASCIMAALWLLMPVEWIITGDTEYTSAAVLFFLADYPGYLIDIFKKITGD